MAKKKNKATTKAKGLKAQAKTETPSAYDEPMRSLPGISVREYLHSPARRPSGVSNIDKKRTLRITGPKVIVILEGAALELHSDQKMGKVKGFFLLDGMKHKAEFSKREDGDDGSDHRPDILHHCLRLLMNSPLNRAGLLAVYIRTKDGQLIEVSPQLDVPECYDDFEAMMTNLLLKKTIKAKAAQRGGRQTLMRFVKNDIDEIMPIGKQLYGLSVNGDDIEGLNLPNWISKTFTQPCPMTDGATVVPEELILHPKPIVIAVGAVAKSDPVTKDVYPEADLIRISKHALTASQCIVKICHGFEQAWRLV